MYEECLRMPFLIRYPKEIKPGTVNKDIILNIDFAPLFLDYAKADVSHDMQGESFRANLRGEKVPDWRDAMYYRYWMNMDNDHEVTGNYGIRTDRYKLVFYYGKSLGMKGTKDITVEPAEWELYDLKEDPHEMRNLYHDPTKKDLIVKLKKQLLELKKKYGDEDSNYPDMKTVVDKYFW